MVVPRSYHGEVSKVVKRSLSFPSEVFAAIEEEARDAGVPVSALVTEATRRWLTIRRGLRAVAEYEAEHGEPTAADLAWADKQLDKALRRSR